MDEAGSDSGSVGRLPRNVEVQVHGLFVEGGDEGVGTEADREIKEVDCGGKW